MKNSEELRRLLQGIDRRGYPAYKDTKGKYDFRSYILGIDKVQGDPFASPSKLSICVDGKKAGFPVWMYEVPCKRIALQDHLTRLFYNKISQYSLKAKGSGKSGLLAVSRCGQEVIERTACEINPADGSVKIRFEAGFPANGRTVQAGQLIRMLFEFVPDCVSHTLYYDKINQEKAETAVCLGEDQQYIRDHLDQNGLTAFVANGALLPRESGVSARPMKRGIPFQSPASLEVTFDLPHYGTIKGMGIKKGITLIAGGGYHGKSTLLKALETGVYNHISGDGREYVITADTALKIRAEDGRSIKKTDISMFVNNLPNKKDTVHFYTEDASGSTSQAANVVEGIESSTSLFLIDEDTCATNFMIRDELMQRVVLREKEPITPFIERVRALYEKEGISSVIVAGSSGSFFHVADYILQMDEYHLKDITELARHEAEAYKMMPDQHPEYKIPTWQRKPKASSVLKGGRIKIKSMGKDSVQINRETIDLRYAEQLIDKEQLTALGHITAYAESHVFDGRKTMREAVAAIRKKLESEGIASIAGERTAPPNMAMPRDQEIYACLNRCRFLNL